MAGFPCAITTAQGPVGRSSTSGQHAVRVQLRLEFLFSPRRSTINGASLIGIDLSSANTDHPVQVSCPVGYTHFIPRAIYFYGPSANTTVTATAGVFSQTGGSEPICLGPVTGQFKRQYRIVYQNDARIAESTSVRKLHGEPHGLRSGRDVAGNHGQFPDAVRLFTLSDASYSIHDSRWKPDRTGRRK